MAFAVVTGARYCLFHVPDLMLDYGTTASQERDLQPDSPFLQALPDRARSFEAAAAYPPNQAFIGNLRPEALPGVPRPWHTVTGASATSGPLGAIVPQDEFYVLLRLADAFDVVWLEMGFVGEMRARLAGSLTPGDLERLGQGHGREALAGRIAAGQAVPLHMERRLVGAVGRAHDRDEALSAQVMLENLVTKASGWWALRHLLQGNQLAPERLDYLIECSEEACGDMNQRGGGNFAKAIAELAGCKRATGSDTRAFCAAPVHSIINAAGLVQAGIYEQIAVVAGGSLAKLGMNARDHLARGMPPLEDCLAAFAMTLGPDDGLSPVIRTDLAGRLPVGAGSSPQAVMEALVVEPLVRGGLRLQDVDRYASELQNPELTEPAGAGDIPRANARMIAALAVRRGEIGRDELDAFVQAHGVPGYVPTQGHVPSGVPYVGPALAALRSGEIRRAMVIGKGSLFLGRMTNLFDGVSVLLERNPGPRAAADAAAHLVAAGPPARLRVGITVPGSELGDAEVLRGAMLAARRHPELEVVLIGGPASTGMEHVPADTEARAHREMERLLERGELAAAVTMHYPFPLGVASVGRVVTPGRGRELLLATVTGTAAADRVEAMVRGAVYGRAVSRGLGVGNPEIGLLNLDGAAVVERVLRQLQERGYTIRLAPSRRGDAAGLLRGNDLLASSADVMVTDSLTGNLILKLLSAYTTGGSCEVSGFGYGPGVGPDFPHVIGIVSRASAEPVIAGALEYAAAMARAGLPRLAAEEWAHAEAAGVRELLRIGAGRRHDAAAAVPAPTAKAVTQEISGVDVLELESAVALLGERGIYAAPGMGCTGPVLLVTPEDEAQARSALVQARYLG